jgi:putative heme transporter
VTAAPPRRRHRWSIAVQIAGTIAVAAGAGWAVYRERVTVTGGLRVLSAHTDPGWAAACIGVQCLSMVFFALSQEQLLRAGGARLTAPWLLCTAYLANAIALAVPVIGSGMAATYAYRQLRERRVDPVIARAALGLGGVISTLAFAAIVTAGALLSGSPAAAVSALGSALTCLIILAAALAALRSPAGRSRLQRLFSQLLRAAQQVLHRPRGDPAQLTKTAIDRLGLFRLGPVTLALAFTWAVLNSAADACCLILSIKAVGVPVPWGGVLLAWSAGQGAGSLSPTPGGIGVVEVTMTAALAAAGLQPADALAAVLLYRIVAFKSVITLAWFAERTFIHHRRGAAGHRDRRRPARGPGRNGRPEPGSSTRSWQRPG